MASTEEVDIRRIVGQVYPRFLNPRRPRRHLAFAEDQPSPDVRFSLFEQTAQAGEVTFSIVREEQGKFERHAEGAGLVAGGAEGRLDNLPRT